MGRSRNFPIATNHSPGKIGLSLPLVCLAANDCSVCCLCGSTEFTTERRLRFAGAIYADKDNEQISRLDPALPAKPRGELPISTAIENDARVRAGTVRDSKDPRHM